MATLSQQQAAPDSDEPDFDDTIDLIDDPAARDQLRDLLRRHDVTGDVELLSDCGGGRVTTVVWSGEQAVSHWLVVDSCRADDLSVEVTDLVDEWLTRGGWPPATQ